MSGYCQQDHIVGMEASAAALELKLSIFEEIVSEGVIDL